MSREILISAFGWMAVLNIAIFALSALLLLTMKDLVSDLHGRMFGLEKATIRQTVYSWLGTYKIMIIVFSLVPYVALKLT